jgi:hypothetical protein
MIWPCWESEIMDLTSSWVAPEIGLLELVIDLVHGFEGVALENFLENLVREIFREPSSFARQ